MKNRKQVLKEVRRIRKTEGRNKVVPHVGQDWQQRLAKLKAPDGQCNCGQPEYQGTGRCKKHFASDERMAGEEDYLEPYYYMIDK
jgi:hypothetical protein